MKIRVSFRDNRLPVIAVLDKISFPFPIVDGKSINVERIAPKATKRCNQRTDANDGRVHKRLYNVSIPIMDQHISHID